MNLLFYYIETSQDESILCTYDQVYNDPNNDKANFVEEDPIGQIIKTNGAFITRIISYLYDICN